MSSSDPWVFGDAWNDCLSLLCSSVRKKLAKLPNAGYICDRVCFEGGVQRQGKVSCLGLWCGS